MEIETHIVDNARLAEIVAGEMIIASAEDAVDLLGNLYYQDYDKVIIHQKHLSPAFFDLQNGMAGEILQKFSNYQVRLAIVGDFSEHTGKSIKAFLYESNKGGQINFVATTAEAVERFSK